LHFVAISIYTVVVVADGCAKIRASSAPYLNPLCIRPHDDDDDDDGPLEE
jgi:hypothetical protein